MGIINNIYVDGKDIAKELKAINEKLTVITKAIAEISGDDIGIMKKKVESMIEQVKKLV